MARDDRTRETQSLATLLSHERARLMDGASAEEREQYRAAERRREVFRAWNDVCAGTREGSHVTGLHYVPEQNELVVYLDSAQWTQEMSMLREIVRARMALRGVDVSRIRCKVSRSEFITEQENGGRAAKRRASAGTPRPTVDISEETRKEIEQAVAGIDDRNLREALERAMIASYVNNISSE